MGCADDASPHTHSRTLTCAHGAAKPTAATGASPSRSSRLWRVFGGWPAQIENQAYPVNVDALNTVFSPYGFVQKIAIFEKNGQSQVMHGAASQRKHAV